MYLLSRLLKHSSTGLDLLNAVSQFTVFVVTNLTETSIVKLNMSFCMLSYCYDRPGKFTENGDLEEN